MKSKEYRIHQLAHWVGGYPLPHTRNTFFENDHPVTEGEIIDYIEKVEGDLEAILTCLHNSLLTYDCWWYKMEQMVKKGEL